MPETDLTTQLADLKRTATDAQRYRAEAEGQLAVAASRLAEIDTELTALGINPDNVEGELTALDAQLRLTISTLTTTLGTEVAAYQEIIKLCQVATK